VSLDRPHGTTVDPDPGVVYAPDNLLCGSVATVSFDNFICKWAASAAAERANKDAFLLDLCDVLEVPKPNPSTGDPEKDTYVFERDALTPHEGGTVSVGKIDLYKEGHFVLEAKQGSEKDSVRQSSFSVCVCPSPLCVRKARQDLCQALSPCS
jgi:hypothetical protein